VTLEGHELFDEINHKLFVAEVELMSKAIDNVNEIIPKAQVKTQGNCYAKRTPEDSRLDPNKTLLQQFNLLRIHRSRSCNSSTILSLISFNKINTEFKVNE
jgi:methionyl-tRNA formyltransferase